MFVSVGRGMGDISHMFNRRVGSLGLVFVRPLVLWVPNIHCRGQVLVSSATTQNNEKKWLKKEMRREQQNQKIFAARNEPNPRNTNNNYILTTPVRVGSDVGTRNEEGWRESKVQTHPLLCAR